MYLAMSVRAVLTAVIGPEIHALVLHEPVDEHVVTPRTTPVHADLAALGQHNVDELRRNELGRFSRSSPVSYTHLRAHETVLDTVCRLLLDKKKIYIALYV